MRTFRDYLTERVDKLATERGYDAYQAATWGDCGWWVFKDNSGNTKAKLYYDFDEDCCTVREGKGPLFGGVKCRYGNDVDENRLFDYLREKLPKVKGLDSVLANATQRSIAAQGERGRDKGERDSIGK